MVAARILGALLLAPALAGCDHPSDAGPPTSAVEPAPTPSDAAAPTECRAPPVPLARRLGDRVEDVVQACKAADPIARDRAIDAQVTGRWKGEYRYEEGEETEITADLRVTAGTLGGEMDEPNTMGIYGYGRLASTLTGDVYATRQIVFMKTYASGGAQHSVLYAGTLSRAGDRIEGRWRTRSLSGTFWLARD